MHVLLLSFVYCLIFLFVLFFPFHILQVWFNNNNSSSNNNRLLCRRLAGPPMWRRQMCIVDRLDLCLSTSLFNSSWLYRPTNNWHQGAVDRRETNHFEFFYSRRKTPLQCCYNLTPSTPAVPNCRCSKGSTPYRSNPPFLIFDIRTLWRSVLSARAPECQKLKKMEILKLKIFKIKIKKWDRRWKG